MLWAKRDLTPLGCINAGGLVEFGPPRVYGSEGVGSLRGVRLGRRGDTLKRGRGSYPSLIDFLIYFCVRQLNRGNFMVNLAKHQQKCVRRRAELSVSMNPFCPSKEKASRYPGYPFFCWWIITGMIV